MKIIINNRYTYPRRVLLKKTLADKGRAMLKKYLEKGGVTADQELKRAFKTSKAVKTSKVVK